MAFTFFRKYNKIILAVGGSLLMVIFLIPQVGSMVATRPGEQPIGTLDGETILAARRIQASNELIILQRLNPELARLPFVVPQGLPAGPDAGVQWMLMVREAREQGLWAGDAQIRFQLTAWQVDADRLVNLQREQNISDAAVRQAVRHYLMVTELRRLTEAPVRISEARLRRFARDTEVVGLPEATGTRVAARVVGIPAERVIGQVGEIDEAELQQHFQQYREVMPGESEPYGFGYRLPPRVKLEYLAFPLQPLREKITIDEVAVQDYYFRHREQLLEEVEGAEATGDDAGATGEVRRRIIDILTDRRAAELRQRAIRTAEAMLAESIRDYPADPTTGYRDLPPVAELVELEAVARRVQAELAGEGVEGYLPEVQRFEDRWLGLAEISELSGFGDAAISVGSGANQRRVPVVQYIASTRALEPSPDNRWAQRYRLQVGLPGEPVHNREQNTAYLFRLLDASPDHAPDSIEEVRAEVTRDLRRLKAYRLLQDRGEGFLATARADGLERLAQSLGEEFSVQRIPPFARRVLYPSLMQQALLQLVQTANPTPAMREQLARFAEPQPAPLPIVGASAAFVDGVFRIAENVERGGGVDALDPAERMTSIPVDEQLTLYLAEVTDFDPLTAQAFDAIRPTLVAMMRQSLFIRMKLAEPDPFGFEQLAARMAFERVSDAQPEEEPPPAEGESVPAPTGG